MMHIHEQQDYGMGHPMKGMQVSLIVLLRGDWSLPSQSELYNYTIGTEAVRSDSMQFFTGVAADYY